MKGFLILALVVLTPLAYSLLPALAFIPIALIVHLVQSGKGRIMDDFMAWLFGLSILGGVVILVQDLF